MSTALLESFTRFWPKALLIPLVASQFLLANVFAGPSDPLATAILKKARNHIGQESVLKNIKSLRYVGRITDQKGEEGTVEIFIRAPYKQLQKVTINDTVVEFGLNDYEAWRRLYRIADPDDYALYPATAGQLKRVRANAFENLNFFSPETNFSRKVTYLGKDTLDGKEVEKVKIVYGTVYFIRYFDTTDGELLYSEIENGEGIKESGEMIVDGVRFPKIVTTYKDGEQVSYVEFEIIEVNPRFSDSLFTQPALPGLKKK